MTWYHTKEFLRGKVIKSFLPFEKHPDLNNGCLKNLYPGDEVYIFETTENNKWARGHAISKPLPSDFTITSVILDDIPRKNTDVVVFPMKYVQILEEIPFSSTVEDIIVPENGHAVPTIGEIESAHRNAKGTDPDDEEKSRRMRIPPLPIATFNESNEFVGEIKYALELLTSHIFALYSIGDFRRFHKLSLIYFSLDETRLKLFTEILTSSEEKVAKETAILLLNKIPKILGSRKVQNNESNRENSDSSGYKAVLARYELTGELLSNSNSIPPKIAFNQVLSSLSAEYPINSHIDNLRYTLETQPNKRFVPKLLSHILLDFKSLQGSSSYHSPGFKGMIVYFYIRYDRVRITETFAVKVNSSKSMIDLKDMNIGLFKNIPSYEISSGNVYLVALVVEEIDLSSKATNKKSNINTFKKGIAVGVADISKIFSDSDFKTSDEHLFKIRLFGSYMDDEADPKSYRFDSIVNNGWGEAIDRIIEGSKTGIAINPRAERLIVSLRDFKHQIHSEFDNNQTKTSIPRIMPIYFDPLTEKHERLYIKMGKVTVFENFSKDDLLTIEASVPDNNSIDFSKASNEDSKKIWQFVTINPNEAIGEIIKMTGISLNNEIQQDEFILFSLYVNGEVIAKAKLIYKSHNNLMVIESKNYIIEFESITKASIIACVKVSTDYVGKIFNSDIAIDNIMQHERILKNGETGMHQLCESIDAINNKLDLHQLIKYFSDLLRALFSIAYISSNLEPSDSICKLMDATFNGIVNLLDIVFGKQGRYLYLIDTFCLENTNLPPIGAFILQNISKVLLQAEHTWTATSVALCRIDALLMKLAILSMKNSTDLQEYFMSLGQIFKSGSSFLSIESEALINSQVLILETIDDVISYDIHIDGVTTLKFIIKFIDSLGSRGLGIDEFSYHTNQAAATERTHRIVLSKLLLINRLFNTFLVNDPSSRKVLVSKAVEWAMEVLQGPTDIEATRIACSILNSVATLLWKTIFVENQKEEITLCYSLSKFLPAIARVITKYNKFTRANGFFKPKRSFTQLFPSVYPFIEFPVDPTVAHEVLVEVLVELSSVFCFIARIGKDSVGDAGYNEILKCEIEDDFFDPSRYLIDNFQSKDIVSLISGINLIRQGKFIPENKWLSLSSLLIEGCLFSLELLSPLLRDYYIPSFENQEKFEKIPWGNYLKCLLKLAVLPPVSIEFLSDGPKKACYQITGNIRNRIAQMISEAWDLLGWESSEENYIRFNIRLFGGYQVKFINTEYSIIHDLMLFALQKDSECQAVAARILWSIMVSEFVSKDSIANVEKECLLGLQVIYYENSYKPNSAEQQKFIDGLKLTIRLDAEDEVFNSVYNFIENLEGFLCALDDYNGVPAGPEFDVDRTFHDLNIKGYLKNANKPELFDSFINMMYEENIKKKDYIQAALCMELLASTCAWDHQAIMPATLKPKFPQQSSFERKETLLNIIAKNYIRGNSLERATDTYNELLDAYNFYSYDLESFANVHGKLAKLYLDLETSDKLSPSYFKVSYIGAGFPKIIRGKIQIHEGLPFEHITSVHERLLKMYPGARIITDDIEAQKLMEKAQTGRYLHVCTVEPVNEISEKLLKASLGARNYAKNKDLRFFTSTKKLPGATSVYDLWCEETTYETNLSFPTLLNKSDIKLSKIVKLSPLDNAIRTIVHKNNDLVQTESMLNNAFKEKSQYQALLGDLTRLLTGTVDSPVNGGVGQYRDFIYDDEYRGGQHLASCKLLSDVFDELTEILNRCLHLHSKLVTPDMKDAHEMLVDLYKKNFAQEIQKLSISTDYSSSYNRISQYLSPVTSQATVERPSISTGSRASGRIIAGPRPPSTDTGSSISSTSSRSRTSGPTASISSVANGSSISGMSGFSKRTVLNWKNLAKRS